MPRASCKAPGYLWLLLLLLLLLLQAALPTALETSLHHCSQPNAAPTGASKKLPVCLPSVRLNPAALSRCLYSDSLPLQAGTALLHRRSRCRFTACSKPWPCPFVSALATTPPAAARLLLHQLPLLLLLLQNPTVPAVQLHPCTRSLRQGSCRSSCPQCA
jgi:hypothetical protein